MHLVGRYLIIWLEMAEWQNQKLEEYFFKLLKLFVTFIDKELFIEILRYDLIS